MRDAVTRMRSPRWIASGARTSKIEASRGKFDWAIADERIAELKKLGIEPLMDVMHFGTPLWLKQAVGDPEFPRRWSASPRQW